MSDIESHYRRRDGSILIEIKLNNVMQLFNSFDPSPFREKDLDDDAEAYIVDTVREFPLSTPLKLALYLPHGELAQTDSATLSYAIRNYFDYRSQVSKRRLHQTLQEGRISLLFGLMFLFFCVAAGEVITRLGDSTFHHILEEGLFIIGWVAMWRPIQIFLYDWWPIVRTRKVYDKIVAMDIEVLYP